MIILILILTLQPIPAQDFSQVNSDEFRTLITDKDGILLDVRTTREFKNGHIPDAGNLNFYALDFRKKLTLLPDDAPIYLYCNTGYRSEKAAEFLAINGYDNVYNLEHGIMEWELKNLPVIVDADASPDKDNKMDPDKYYAILESESPVFIDFYAPWCGPCREMMPMIDSLKVDYHDKVRMYKVNVDASKKLVKELQLGSVPYLVLFENSEIVFSRNGSVTRQELRDVFDISIQNYTK